MARVPIGVPIKGLIKNGRFYVPDIYNNIVNVNKEKLSHKDE